MNRRRGIYLIVLAIVLVGLLLAAVLSRRSVQQVFILQPTPVPTPAPTPTVTPVFIPAPTSSPAPTLTSNISDLISIASPLPNQAVNSPLTISGQARGPWFFEAEAPVQLFDGNGQVIAQGSIRAERNWQTPDFVPFAGVLNFSTPPTDVGQLVLQNANPSGLPQNSRQIIIPVRFR
ncbi:MAG: Gmad2 immunoglobulin-like domain-containing protein [Patescibacteria group bacterium]|nr:Gmad2 immunoglobulin-like domain-containing protein [Patescibacteria group bacterium]